MTGAELTQAQLQGARYDAHTRFPEAFAYKSSGAIGPQANLNGMPLNTANLREADLAGASLLGAYLGGADLTGADLRGARLAQGGFALVDVDGGQSAPGPPQWGQFGGG